MSEEKQQEKQPRAALIVIGNEILSGRTQDTNTMWIAERLMQHGITLTEARTVPDIEEKIIEALSALRRDNNYVFTTGGIGPTHDDITAESIARAFDVPLEKNDEALCILKEHYKPEDLTPPVMKMALIPKGADLIPNPVSAAPGFVIENVYVMAGVPRIMQAMLDHILRSLEPGKRVLSNTIACDLPESALAEALGELQKKYPDVEIGS